MAKSNAKEVVMSQMELPLFSSADKPNRVVRRGALRTHFQNEEEVVVFAREATMSGGARNLSLPAHKAAAAARYYGTGLVLGL